MGSRHADHGDLVRDERTGQRGRRRDQRQGRAGTDERGADRRGGRVGDEDAPRPRADALPCHGTRHGDAGGGDIAGRGVNRHPAPPRDPRAPRARLTRGSRALGLVAHDDRGDALRDQDLDEEARDRRGSDDHRGLARADAGARVERVRERSRAGEGGRGRTRHLEAARTRLGERHEPARRSRDLRGHRALASGRAHRRAPAPTHVALAARIHGAHEHALADERGGLGAGCDHSTDCGSALRGLDRDDRVAGGHGAIRRSAHQAGGLVRDAIGMATSTVSSPEGRSRSSSVSLGSLSAPRS